MLVNDGFGDESDMEKGIKIVSIITSFVSLMYGMASYNLHQLYQTEVGLVQVFKFLLVNLLCQMVMMVLPLLFMCAFSTLIFVAKAEELKCTLSEEINFFQKNSVILTHYQTREVLELKHKDVVMLSVFYIVMTLMTAFMTIGFIDRVDNSNRREGIRAKYIICRVVSKALDPNNIANPLNSLYSSISYSKEEQESLPELRRRVSLVQSMHSSLLLFVLCLVFHQGYVSYITNNVHNGELCMLMKDKSLRLVIFMSVCGIISLVSLIMSGLELLMEECGFKWLTYIVKYAYIIEEETGENEHGTTKDEDDNVEDDNALNQTLLPQSRDEIVDDVEMQPLKNNDHPVDKLTSVEEENENTEK